MTAPRSDALVLFGATGDLAHKKIFPALQAMIRRGRLDVPIVGVGRSRWSLDQFKARARDSLEEHGGLDPAAYAKLASLLHYVDGDYGDLATFARLREALGSAQRPLHYLLVPPSVFPTVVEGLAEGRLDQKVGYDATDEVGRLATALDATVDRLATTLRRIATASTTLAGASGELTTVATQLSASAEELGAQAEALKGVIAGFKV